MSLVQSFIAEMQTIAPLLKFSFSNSSRSLSCTIGAAGGGAPGYGATGATRAGGGRRGRGAAGRRAGRNAARPGRDVTAQMSSADTVMTEGSGKPYADFRDAVPNEYLCPITQVSERKREMGIESVRARQSEIEWQSDTETGETFFYI